VPSLIKPVNESYGVNDIIRIFIKNKIIKNIVVPTWGRPKFYGGKKLII
tara:strand:- start:13 stop:159 length:147 start_codon:yes stop_codon:yes gene_type:complete